MKNILQFISTFWRNISISLDELAPLVVFKIVIIFRDATLCSISQYELNVYIARYDIEIERRCISVKNITHFISSKAIQ